MAWRYRCPGGRTYSVVSSIGVVALGALLVVRDLGGGITGLGFAAFTVVVCALVMWRSLFAVVVSIAVDGEVTLLGGVFRTWRVATARIEQVVVPRGGVLGSFKAEGKSLAVLVPTRRARSAMLSLAETIRGEVGPQVDVVH